MASLINRSNVCHVGFYANGRRIRRSLGAAKKVDALARKEAVERRIAAGRYEFNVIDPPFEEFVAACFEWAARQKTPKHGQEGRNVVVSCSREADNSMAKAAGKDIEMMRTATALNVKTVEPSHAMRCRVPGRLSG